MMVSPLPSHGEVLQLLPLSPGETSLNPPPLSLTSSGKALHCPPPPSGEISVGLAADGIVASPADNDGGPVVPEALPALSCVVLVMVGMMAGDVVDISCLR